MNYPEPLWLIGGEPREVQLEAIRRSFYGYKTKDHKDADSNPVQIRERLVPTRNWGHLMEMRLGKTPTFLNEIALFQNYYDFERAVVFSPNQYKLDWILEAEKYGMDLPFIPYSQSKLKQVKAELDKAKNKAVLVVNYEALQYGKTVEFLTSEFVDKKTIIGADESITIKSRTSLTHKGAMEVREKAAVGRILTGLPMSQGPTDYYGQARFLGMYENRNFYAFRNKYCTMGGFQGKKIKGVKNEDKLWKDINSTGFFAKKKDWGTETEADYYQMSLEMSPEQKKHYEEMDRELITMIESVDGDVDVITAEQVISKLMKLQQISSGFVYNEDGDAIEIMDPMKTPKIKALAWMNENQISSKIVVACHYNKSNDLLLKALAEYKPAVILSDVRMKELGRDTISEKKRFNEDPSCKVMIGALKPLKYGHDLSGSEEHRCDTMFFFENNYSLDNRVQVEARNTTAFQTWANTYIDPYCSKVELESVKALIEKRNLVEAVTGVMREGRKDNVEYPHAPPSD